MCYKYHVRILDDIPNVDGSIHIDYVGDVKVDDDGCHKDRGCEDDQDPNGSWDGLQASIAFIEKSKDDDELQQTADHDPATR